MKRDKGQFDKADIRQRIAQQRRLAWELEARGDREAARMARDQLEVLMEELWALRYNALKLTIL